MLDICAFTFFLSPSYPCHIVCVCLCEQMNGFFPSLFSFSPLLLLSYMFAGRLYTLFGHMDQCRKTWAVIST